MNIKLNLPQIQFLQSKKRGTILLSAIGCGKSFILVHKAINLALEGNRGLILSYSLNNIRDNLIPLFREILLSRGFQEQIHFSITKSPSINVNILGTEIMLRTGSFADRLRGPSVGFLMFEEARELTRDVFDIGLGRLRTGDNLQWFIVTTTRGRDWVYDIIKEQDMLHIFDTDNRVIEDDYLRIIRTTIDEQFHLSQEYIRDLKKQYTSSFARQELYAEIIDSNSEIFNPEWFPIRSLSDPIKGVRMWDIAVSTKSIADFSASCLMSKTDKYYVYNIKRVKLQYPDLKKVIIQTAQQDGNNITIVIEDAGQQRAIVDDLRRDPSLSSYNIRTYRPTKDKITRAYPVASQAEMGNIILNDGPWLRLFKDELAAFSSESVNSSKFKDDQIDALTGAYYSLSTGSASFGQLGM